MRRIVLFTVILSQLSVLYGQSLNQLLVNVGTGKPLERKQASIAISKLLQKKQEEFLQQIYKSDAQDPERSKGSERGERLQQELRQLVVQVEDYLKAHRNDPEIAATLHRILEGIIPSQVCDMDYRIRKLFIRPSLTANPRQAGRVS